MLESSSKHVYVDLKKTGAPLSEKLRFLEKEVHSSSVDFTKDFRLYEFSVAENKEFMNNVRSMYSMLCRYASDKRKKQLCKSLKYFLIEFKYDEELTEDFVKKKIEKFLKVSLYE